MGFTMSFWNNRPLLIAIVLLIVLVVLLFATTDVTSQKKSVVGELIAPAQGSLYNMTSRIGAFFGRLFSSSDLAKENLALKEQVETLQGQLQKYDELMAENERLKEMMGVKETYPDYDMITAQVIGNTPGGWFREFTINAGTLDGVQEGMVVVTANGLLGRVLYASGNHARVMSLIDDKSGVSVLIERTRDTGVVKTNNTVGAGTLEVLYLPVDADVVPGDKVVTSGLGGIYPKGLVVGTVYQVSGGVSTDKKVYVSSSVDFKHVEEVVVLKYLFDEVEE